MVTEEQLNELGKFTTSSWAIWSDTFNKSGPEEKPETLKEFIYSNRYILKNNIILMGLNRSGNEEKIKKSTFSNFHAIGHRGDGLLKETIMPLSNIKGAYMTDLSELVESKSEKVCLKTEDKEKVAEQLKILNSKNFTFIVFGDKAFDFICRKFKVNSNVKFIEEDIKEVSVSINDISAKVFRVRHYSNWDLKSKALFKAQLKYLNDKVLNG
jgi:hypothetical protein